MLIGESLKVKSMKEDMINYVGGRPEYLTSKNLTEMANICLKVLSQIQSTCLSTL